MEQVQNLLNLVKKRDERIKQLESDLKEFYQIKKLLGPRKTRFSPPKKIIYPILQFIDIWDAVQDLQNQGLTKFTEYDIINSSNGNITQPDIHEYFSYDFSKYPDFYFGDLDNVKVYLVDSVWQIEC